LWAEQPARFLRQDHSHQDRQILGNFGMPTEIDDFPKPPVKRYPKREAAQCHVVMTFDRLLSAFTLCTFRSYFTMGIRIATNKHTTRLTRFTAVASCLTLEASDAPDWLLLKLTV
jgi:hypothetical protein